MATQVEKETSQEREPTEQLDDSREGGVTGDDEGAGDGESDAEVRDAGDGGAEVDLHRESRRERRQREARERIDRTIADAMKPLREQNEALARQLREMSMGLMQRPLQPAPPEQRQEQAADEDEEAYTNIKRKQADVIARIRRAPAEKLDELQKEWERLERQSVKLVADSAAKRALSEYKPPAQMNPHEQVLRSEFPDVFGHQKALGYAWSLFTQARDEAEIRGEQFDYAAGHKAALTKAAQVFGLRKAPPPPPPKGQRERFAAPGGSSSAGAGGQVTRKLSKEERKMALASDSSDRSDAEKIARWTKAMERAGYWEEDK